MLLMGNNMSKQKRKYNRTNWTSNWKEDCLVKQSPDWHEGRWNKDKEDKRVDFGWEGAEENSL